MVPFGSSSQFPVPGKSREVWLVGKWAEPRFARSAKASLLTAARRGLGLTSAIGLAREVAEDPAVGALGEEQVLDWVEENYGLYPQHGFSVEITCGKNQEWALHVRLHGSPETRDNNPGWS